MSRGKCRLSSTEVLLGTLVLVLLGVCVALIIVSWLALSTGSNEDHLDENRLALSGRLVISKGAMFTEELRNRSSIQFKALAFDTEQLIAEAYGRGSLTDQYKGCDVRDFSQGSVVVSLELLFRQAVAPEEAAQQLGEGLQNGGGGTQGGLVIDIDSIQVTDKEDLTTTQLPTTNKPSTTSVPVKCPDEQRACDDGKTCIPTIQFCDGIPTCPDGSDENEKLCATVCDGQFLLLGSTGSFHSENFPQPYNNDTVCRWVIRVHRGMAIKVEFHSFRTEEDIDSLKLYEGTGPRKNLTYTLSGLSPGTVWLLSHEATVEFTSDFINNLHGFNASYWAMDVSHLTNEEKVYCSFEEGLCFWSQESEDDGDWVRTKGPTFPPFTGPSFDHTLGNQSGHYVVTSGGPGNWEKIFRIYSLPLSHGNESMCLRFWYHMFGEDVRRLRVLAERGSAVTPLFQKEGNYGDHWNYGQVTLNSTAEQTVVFEAQKRGGLRNDIALDDISMTDGPCIGGPPDPTPVPPPITPPPIAPDCGGPFHLWEPNTTFSSPNYPNGYGNNVSCVWVLHAKEGQNIQLHFLDFALETAYDVVEVRDGVGPHSDLLGVFTGQHVFPDLFSSSNQMTVMLFTDRSGSDVGFRANFTSGLALGRPEPCPTGQFLCGSGVCVSNSSVCDGVPDCPNASDEGDCVRLVSVSDSSTKRLQLQVHSTDYTACAHNWTSQLSHFLCRYQGYRSGNASLVPVMVEDSPFTTVSVTANGTLDFTPSQNCPGDEVISLHCNNQPCGLRQLSQKSGRSASAERGMENREIGERGMVKEEKNNQEDLLGRVVGGTDAQKGAWPWMVSLRWMGRNVCGASLIDREWLITAAHCVYGKNVHLSNWVAVLGLHSQYGLDVDKQTHQVDQVIMSKHYNRRTKDADIALMHLRTQVNFTDYIQPICLPRLEQQFAAGRKCFIAGWGREAEEGPVADVLQQAALPLINSTQCQEWLPEYNLTARMVCAGYTEGGVDSCQGDSGGPLMCEQDGRWVLVGVTSFGVGCGRPQRPGVYALVSQFTDWVLDTRRRASHWDGW